MSVKTNMVCDRCGKEIANRRGLCRGYFTRGIRRLNTIGLHVVACGDTTGYDYCAYTYDLCDKCTKELMEWMETPKGERKW